MYAQKLTQACIGYRACSNSWHTHTHTGYSANHQNDNKVPFTEKDTNFFFGLFPALPLTHQHGQPA